MTFADGIQQFETDLVSRMRTSFAMARNAARKNRAYRQTFKELSALSPRELDDLGIHGANIREIAYKSAYES